MVAALECLRKGRTVRVVDRCRPDETGGLARWAFGGMALVDTPLQRKARIRDSAELALADWESFAEFEADDVWPRRWAECYVQCCTDRVFAYLSDLGLSFVPAVNWVERGLYGDGNSVPRYHILWGTGAGLVACLDGQLKSHPNAAKLNVAFRTRVEDLIVDGGRVCGCRIVDEDDGRQDEVFAKHVIIASGGIAGCLQKVRKHWYAPWGHPPGELLNGSHPYADGLMHDRVKTLGGAVTHLDKMWNYAAGIPHPQAQFEGHGLSLIPCKSALWLDHAGRRIGPDPLVTGFDTNDLCRRVSLLEQPWTWQLLNRRIAEREFAISGAEHNPHIRDRRVMPLLRETLFGSRRLIGQMLADSDHVIEADDLESLVAKMNRLNPDHPVVLQHLREAADSFDAIVRRGRPCWNDPQLRRIEHARAWRPDRLRTCSPRPLLEKKAGPLIAIKLRQISRKSLGGIRTDLGSRVLTSSGAHLPGLYAVGEAAGFGGGGASGRRSLEGTFLSGCILTARAAADTITAG